MRAALHREDVIGRLHERDRVDRAAVDADFIVEVVAGRAAGRAHAADQLAAGDRARRRWTVIARQVAVAGGRCRGHGRS